MSTAITGCSMALNLSMVSTRFHVAGVGSSMAIASEYLAFVGMDSILPSKSSMELTKSNCTYDVFLLRASPSLVAVRITALSKRVKACLIKSADAISSMGCMSGCMLQLPLMMSAHNVSGTGHCCPCLTQSYSASSSFVM